LGGRYRLDRRIGGGGMGTVFSGVDQELDRRVAVKVIRPELSGNEDWIARFRREARAAAGITHPNIVTVYDFGVDRQVPFIVMELLSGRTLRAELDDGKSLPPQRMIEIMRGICSAMDYAHQRDLLHRDIKPANIFLAETATGEAVKILDFGLVKIQTTSSNASTATEPSIVAGTPQYMAPELILGDRASRASDVWAIGVVAYEMVTGIQPFVNARQPALSPVWQSLFDRVFQRDPAQRMDSARMFQSEFENALNSSGAAALTRG
jgi:serine/threonine protein kinase